MNKEDKKASRNKNVFINIDITLFSDNLRKIRKKIIADIILARIAFTSTKTHCFKIIIFQAFLHSMYHK